MTLSNRCVHVVDADVIYRAKIVDLLRTVRLETTEAESAESLLERYDPERESCIISEIRLPGMSGLAMLKQLGARQDSPPLIFATAHADVATAVEAMKAGAREFFQKPVEPQKMIDTVYEALEVANGVRRRGRQREICKNLLAQLTRREREVLESLVRGHPNRTIATSLGIRERTVEAHRSGIMRKLNARSIVEVVRCAFAAGIDDPATDETSVTRSDHSNYNSKTEIRSLA